MHNWQLHLPWIFIVSKALLIGHITWFSVVQSARNARDLRTRDKQLIRLQITYKHPCWSSLDRDFSARGGSLCVVTLGTWVKQAWLCLYLDLLQNTKQALHNVIDPDSTLWPSAVQCLCLLIFPLHSKDLKLRTYAGKRLTPWLPKRHSHTDIHIVKYLWAIAYL